MKLECAVRVIDCFLESGVCMLFRIALAIFAEAEQELLEKGNDEGTAITLLTKRSLMVSYDDSGDALNIGKLSKSPSPLLSSLSSPLLSSPLLSSPLLSSPLLSSPLLSSPLLSSPLLSSPLLSSPLLSSPLLSSPPSSPLLSPLLSSPPLPSLIDAGLNRFQKITFHDIQQLRLKHRIGIIQVSKSEVSSS